MIKKRIIDKGYPTTSKYYPVAHMLASKEEKQTFGAKPYHKLELLAKKHPGELLGTHHGNKIIISSIVPKSLRAEVRFHEKREIERMRELRQKRKTSVYRPHHQ